MHETIKKMAQAFARQREQRRRACAVFTALAILVSLTTTYMLVQPANTLAVDYVCGMEAHTHSDDCYELICGYEDDVEAGGVIFEEETEPDEDVTDAETAEDILDGEETPEEENTADEPTDTETPVEEETTKETEVKEEPEVEKETQEEPKVEEPAVVVPEEKVPAEEEVKTESETTEPSVPQETPAETEQPVAPAPQETPVVEEKVEAPVVEEVPAAPAAPAAPVVQEAPVAPSAPVAVSEPDVGTDSGSEAFSGMISMAMVMYSNGAEGTEGTSEPAAPSEPAHESTDTTSAPVQPPVEAPVVEVPAVETPVEEDVFTETPVVEDVADETTSAEEETTEETEVNEESADEEIVNEETVDQEVSGESSVEQESSSGSGAVGHVHTAACYKLTCGLPEHEHSEDCMSLMNLIEDLGELPEAYHKENGGEEYSKIGDGYTVAVFAPKNALPENAKLVVTLLDEEKHPEEYATAQQTLEAMVAQEIEINVAGVMSDADLEAVAIVSEDAVPVEPVEAVEEDTLTPVESDQNAVIEEDNAEVTEPTDEAVEESLADSESVEGNPVPQEEPVVDEAPAEGEVLTASLVHNDNAPAEEAQEEVAETTEVGQETEEVLDVEVTDEVTEAPEELVNADPVPYEEEFSYDEFVALDIHFEWKGQEIEPDRPVFVYINVDGFLEDADPTSVKIQHHVESKEEEKTSEPNVEFVDMVADNNDNSGEVKVTEENVASLFKVDSFSLFTVTWSNTPNMSLDLQLVNESGASIAGPREVKITENQADKWLYLSDLAPDISGPYGPSHQYKEAKVEQEDPLTRVQFKSAENEWYYSNNGNGEAPLGSKQIYVYYQESYYINIDYYRPEYDVFWDETTGSGAHGTQTFNANGDNNIASVELGTGENRTVTWANSGAYPGMRPGGWNKGAAQEVGSYYPHANRNQKETTQLVITPEPGFYVTHVTVACCPMPHLTPYYCQTWEHNVAFDRNMGISPEGKVIIDLPVLAFCHLSNKGGQWDVDSYFILIQTAPLPDPLYVEYDYGDIQTLLINDGKYNADTTVFKAGQTWTEDHESYNNDNGNDSVTVTANDTRMKYVHAKAWKHKTNQLTTEATQEANNGGYEFTGWKVQYYSSCNESFEFKNDVFNPFLIGENEDLRLATHVRLVAQWEPKEPEPTTLTVTKMVEAPEDHPNAGDSFTFQVVQNGTPLSGVSYDIYEDEADTGRDGTTNENGQFSLSGGQSAVFYQKMSETGTYTVQEVIAAGDNEWLAAVQYQIGNEDPSDDYPPTEKAGFVGPENISGATDQDVTFTNKLKDMTGDLAIYKKVVENGSDSTTNTKSFDFTISNIPTDDYKIHRTDALGNITSTDTMHFDVSGTTVTITEGTGIIICGVRKGTQVTVTEAEYPGYAVSWNVDNGNETFDRTATATVDSARIVGATNGPVMINFTNRTGTELPNTGGMGTNHFTTLGLGLMLGAGVLLLDQRRRKDFSAS